MNLFVGEKLIHRLRVPEITVGKVGGGNVARAGLVELGDDLIAIVNENRVLVRLAGNR